MPPKIRCMLNVYKRNTSKSWRAKWDQICCMPDHTSVWATKSLLSNLEKKKKRFTRPCRWWIIFHSRTTSPYTQHRISLVFISKENVLMKSRLSNPRPNMAADTPFVVWSDPCKERESVSGEGEYFLKEGVNNFPGIFTGESYICSTGLSLTSDTGKGNGFQDWNPGPVLPIL